MSLAPSSSTSRNPGSPFTAGLLSEKLVDSAGNNATDLYCPLGGCRCLMLRKGSAKLVKRDGDAVSSTQHSYLVRQSKKTHYCSFVPKLLHPSAKPIKAQSDEFPIATSSSDSSSESQQECWLVTSPLTFENIGFTKGVVSNSTQVIASLPEGASVRYLACADCDCGPLGWHVESKGSDLGRDVDVEINKGGAGAGNSGPIREFLIAVERCRYKLE